MLESVLVANRGEIAVRIFRTLACLGVEGVAVYNDADRDALHVEMADRALRIGPDALDESYLNADAIIAAARRAGVQAVHPGYGFLAENAEFADRCQQAGLVFIGPPPKVLALMGDKIAARRAAVSAGVPVLAASTEAAHSDAELRDAALGIGLPVLVKAAAGGGGKAMHLVTTADQLEASIATSQQEAARAFGDDRIYVEQYVRRARHIEVQIFGDTTGAVVSLGERDCSVQRRYQKILEESPPPGLEDQICEEMRLHATALTRSCGYVGAGTVEFVLSIPDGHFYFLEMNTRLQVEHGVTELRTGLDLVALQLRVANGEELTSIFDSVVFKGHAIEARICSEDPGRDFLPAGGSVLALRQPNLPHVRVDSGVRVGSAISGSFDPLLLKVMAVGPDRRSAVARLRHALTRTAILGVQTNLAFLLALLDSHEVRVGELDTALAERLQQSTALRPSPPLRVLIAAVLVAATRNNERTALEMRGWRLGDAVFSSWRLECADEALPTVRFRGTLAAGEVALAGEAPRTVSAWLVDDTLRLEFDDETSFHLVAVADDGVWVEANGAGWHLRLAGQSARVDAGDVAVGPLRSPTPGTVIAVHVVVGDQVKRGAPLVTIEAMKMEHAVVARHDGTVAQVAVDEGDRVKMDQPLVVLEQPA